MSSVAEPVTTTPPPRKRWFSVTPAVEFGVLGVAMAVAIATYFILTRDPSSQRLLTPLLVALLLVANMVPAIALLVLLGRRVARRRAARSEAGGGEMHVRLVAIFSVLASVPTLFLAVFASLLFQYGVEFWTSDQARSMLDNASRLAGESYTRELNKVGRETTVMREDLLFYLQTMPVDSDQFIYGFGTQVYRRGLSEGMILEVSPDHEIRSLALVNPHDRPLETLVTPEMVRQIDQGKDSVVVRGQDRIGVLTYFNKNAKLYLYAALTLDPLLASQLQRSEQIQSDYRTLMHRSRSLQLQFNAALLALSLLIVGIAVVIALAVADRLVRPVNELVRAARLVAGGDLTARVTEPRTNDEIGTLGVAFNRMTERLQEQTGELVTANAQLESRRALIEAVMSGVSAGVISIDANRRVRLTNESARALLRHGEQDLVGRTLADIAPELDAMLDGAEREAVVQVTTGSEARTLAVKITRDEGGQVLTFDDITQQLLDQRRAAWSDVARRIAHEIKNPLTPIQLAAERLQRRYGKLAEAEDGVFARLTETIVRQVGDLRRMVDEFSSFARMPKPVFREESLLDIARQAMFLHEVAHPAIAFHLNVPDGPVPLVCDRRQMGQALTNVVKNAVEAVEARGEGEALPRGEITLAIVQGEDGRITLTVADNGIGLPVERDRIAEPYMTTRARGTGLGLAIVKKIVEEHFGTIGFSDRDGGGTVVTINLDPAQVASMAIDTPGEESPEPRPAALTRSGSKQ
ncbi:ATP-binding protein [Sphingomonas canadensis]|uniref:histidine kinase n=1 Tax=Sphingomonas canadensis TaxID=1219257 RepID=A0ABW3HCS7_9SPHN|nr:ATP-binding protein [Sphingomonas canadensis]MCW3837978.1 ATP-binding protein [Sphingomonas canadensis]